MKKIVLIISLITIQGISAGALYDMELPLSGKSVADDTLQFQVMNGIYSRIIKKYPACNSYSISDTQIIEYPKNLKKRKKRYISGEWKELWSVDVCGKKKQIPIDFKINKNGAEYYIDDKLIEFI